MKSMRMINLWRHAIMLALCSMTLTSCGDDENDDPVPKPDPITLRCARPDYLTTPTWRT